MSWSVARSYRLNTVSHAVTVALLCACGTAIPLAAQAATLGAVQVHSAQNEPLSASIAVSDVDVAHFSAYLAGNGLYQEMGLTPNPTINARFVADSLTQGRIVISSTQPIAMPFADVVLTLNNNGNRDILPKTLLMPLERPALMHAPLMVQNSAPPALNTTPTNVRPITQQLEAPLLAQQSIVVRPLSVVVSDVMPPMPSAVNANANKVSLLAQQVLPQTPLSVIKTSAMPPMPSKAISNPAYPLANAPILFAEQQSQQDIQPITMQQPVRLDSALDTVLPVSATQTAPAPIVHQPLQAQRLTALPALPSSQANLSSPSLFTKRTENPTPNTKKITVTHTEKASASAYTDGLQAAVTTNAQAQTKNRPASEAALKTTSAPKLQAVNNTTQNTVSIQTTRRITRVLLPEQPAFIDAIDNDIARNSSHDGPDNAMLADLTDSSRTMVRSQMRAPWPNTAHSHAAFLIKNQKAIEQEAHLQEISN